MFKNLISLSLLALSCACSMQAQSLPYGAVRFDLVDQNGNVQHQDTPTGGNSASEYFYVDGNGQPQHRATTFTTAGTAAGIVTNFSGVLRRSVLKVTIPFTTFSAAAKTADVVVATIQAKTRIVGCIMDVTVAFTGGGESAAVMKLGSTTSGAQVMASGDVFTAAATYGLADADMGSSLTRAASIQAGYLPSWTGSTNLSARLTTTTNNTSALTAGSVTFYIITEAL